MKILLFGLNGQIGSSVYSVLKNDYQIIGVGRNEADFTEPVTVLNIIKSVKPTCVINAAAYTHVDMAEDDKKKCWQVNAQTVGLISRYCRDHKIALIHFSTDYVFDGKQHQAYVETDSTNPSNFYGQSKLAGEQYVEKSGCRYLIVRFSWVVSSTHHCFLKTIYELVQSKRKISVVNDQYGAPTSNQFIASVLSLAIRHFDRIENGIYHLSCKGSVSWFDYTKFIIYQLKQNSSCKVLAEVHPVSSLEYGSRAKRPQHSTLNCDKLFNLIGAERLGWKEDSADQIEELIANDL